MVESKKRKITLGTKEVGWGQPFNICKKDSRCNHQCKFCYFYLNAQVRFKWISGNPKEQIRMKVDNKKVLKRIGKRKNVQMFPTSHDILPFMAIRSRMVVKKHLRVGNKILIVTKPHLSCIQKIVSIFENDKYIPFISNLEIRFTITNYDKRLNHFWQPGVPSFEEIIECIKLVGKSKIKLSLSLEPYLHNPYLIICYLIQNNLLKYIYQIWIGKANYLSRIKSLYLKYGRSTDRVQQYFEYQEKLCSLEYVLEIINNFQMLPGDVQRKIIFKDSIFNFLNRNGYEVKNMEEIKYMDVANPKIMKEIKRLKTMNNKENNEITFTWGKTHKIIKEINGIDVFPHILIDSTNQIDGWNFYDYEKNGRRECSQERLSVRCYCGCPQKNEIIGKATKGCSICYTQNLGYWGKDKVAGYFQAFWDYNVATVYYKMPEAVEKQISKLYCIFPLYHSTTTDPFNELEGHYHLTKQIIENSLKWNVPQEFITKMGHNLSRWKGYSGMLDKMVKQQHSFAQFTIYAIEEIRKYISPGSSPVKEQLKAVKLCSNKGLFSIVRIDPIIPFISDKLEHLEYLILQAKENGASHIIASVLDVASRMKNKMFTNFNKISKNLGDEKTKKDYESLYSVKFGSEYHANNEYREEIFSLLKKLCSENDLTFSLCMEFYKHQKDSRFLGYNDKFMTSKACEGMDIPLYYRIDLKERFKPLSKCDGNCLSYAKRKGNCNGICNYEPFQKAKANKYSIYRKFKPEIIDQKLVKQLTIEGFNKK